MRLFLFIAALFMTSGLYAQAPNIQWQKSLGGSGNDWAHSIQQTSDGGYIVAGVNNSNGGDVSGNHGEADAWIVKLNATGNIQWQKSLGGSGSDRANSISQTSDGGYIMAGYSLSYDGDVSGNHGNGDYWIVKLNATGNIQWQKSLGGIDNDEAQSIQQTSDGGYIVAGWSFSTDGDVSGNHGSGDFWIVKLNATGNILWQKSLGGSGSDGAYSIRQTSDGGYIVSGYSRSNDGDVSGSHGNADYWIVKLDATGNIQWQKSLGGSGDETTGLSIVQTTDGGYIVSGYSRSTDGDVSGNHGDADAWIVKLNATGSILWQKSLGGSGADGANYIQQTSDGGYIIAGVNSSNDGDVSGNHGKADYWIVKLNTTGDIQWQKSLGGSNDESAWYIGQTTDGGYIVVGWSLSNDGDVSGNHGKQDSWVVKLSKGCPDLATAPDNVVIVNSTCGVGCTVSGGSIAAPSGGCPAGSTLQYSTDNGTTWSANIPTYNQSGPEQTIMTRCNCDADNSISSPASSGVFTAPGVCKSPTATAGSNSPACAGSTIDLTASGGISYSWSGPGEFTSTMQNPTITNAATIMTGMYTVTVSDGNGCTGTATISVEVDEEIFTTITRATDNLAVDVSGGTPPYTYLWSNGSTENYTIINGIGTYSVTVTDALECQKVDELEITVSTASIDGRELNIYPNPTMDIITIELPKNLGEGRLILYNQSGHKVMEEKRDFHTCFNQDISNLIPGIYIVRILTGIDVYGGKIVKQ